MAEKDKKPEIRFTGFTDAWEQREYSETFIKIPNNTLSRAELNYNSGLAKNLHYGDVLIKFGELLDVEKDEIPYITGVALLNKLRSSKLQSGDVIIADAAEDETVGKCTELVNVGEETVVSGLHTIPSRPTLTFASGYLGYFMNSPAYHTQLLRLMQGTKVTSISKAALQDTVIFYPIDSVEQCKISKLFQQLNNLITLHQRKHDKLVIVKKSMLEKMFPKDGANVPEIRFAGFIDAWEQRKLKEISDKVLEKNVNLRYAETFTNSAEFGIISQRDFFDHDISNAKNLGSYYVIRNEDFVYNPRISTFAPVGPINRNKLGRTGVMSPLYTVFRTHDIDNTFLEQYFRSRYWHSFMKLNGDSGARSDRFSIKDSVLIEMPIPYPSLKEQLKIGEFLTQLDNYITLQQRELEKLKNIKKAMLGKMFV